METRDKQGNLVGLNTQGDRWSKSEQSLGWNQQENGGSYQVLMEEGNTPGNTKIDRS